MLERVRRTELPILEALPDLHRALSAGNAVLEAPPGAGKTTLVPLALLDESWLEGRRIVMLEPRRLAARAAAGRMAALCGDQVGGLVGYRIRMDTRVSPRTRIEVVTEGILTSMLQRDPIQEDVGIIIFDEFHERSMHADLGLALALDVQTSLRDDLRLLVMSATLDAARTATFLRSPLIRSHGRMHDVAISHHPPDPDKRTVDHVARIVAEAVNETDGDILVFLPGEGEIRRIEQRLRDLVLPPSADIRPLFGNLPASDQDIAIAPSPAGRRKVVLATNIAETSLTIEGVTAVVDSGLVRRPRFHAGRGMTVLETARVSRSSAAQRAGRAGRLGPGRCFRLWSQLEEEHLRGHDPPEILLQDLAPLALELARWGVRSANELRWMDAPPPERIDDAYALLRQLGAVGNDRGITSHGKRIARLAAHPRLAHMLESARTVEERRVAGVLAAVLSDRDPIRSNDEPEPDIRLRLDVLAGAGGAALPRGTWINHAAVERIRASARDLAKRLPSSLAMRDADVGRLLATAYPDRVAVTESDGRYRLRSGDRLTVPAGSLLSENRFIVAAHVAGRGSAGRRLRLGAAIDEAALRDLFADDIQMEHVVYWDDRSRTVVAERREVLEAVVLSSSPDPTPDPDHAAGLLIEFIRREGLQVLPWTRDAESFRQRIAFLRTLDASWPDVSDGALLKAADVWLRPYLNGMRRASDLKRIDLMQLLQHYTGWERAAEVERLAPSHFSVPSGSRIRIDYSNSRAPVLPVRIQEMFGSRETPRIADGRVPLTLHLLSPAHRPAQITQDLAGFWRGAYSDVRRELRGRYPKHDWPEDPLGALPTSRPTRR